VLVENNSKVIDCIEILTLVSLNVSTKEFMNNASSPDDSNEWIGLNGKAK
jgi:hypothetical protein